MQLLFEEFFKKVFKVTDGSSWAFKILIKAIIFILIIGVLLLVAYSYLSGNYILLVLILGIVIIAESSHLIRKSREKVMVGKATEKNLIKEHSKEMLKPQKAKNKHLLEIGKVKNERLLKVEKVKNEGC